MGFRGRYKNKRDANEPEIFATLRAYGLSVCPLDYPCDALIGYGGRTYLVEVKTPEGKYTAAQEDFREDWKGDYTTLRTEEEAAAFARVVKGLER